MGENANESFGVLDFETDPFLAGRIPLPFAACIFFSRNDYCLLWDADSKTEFLTRVVRQLRRLPPCTLYAHNGGKFDFHYLLEFADFENLEIRNGRVVKMQIGKVTLKDSFPLMPFPLAEFRKTKIDYAIFEQHKRNRAANRRRIETYLLDDCIDLHELLTGFRRVVGPRDTIGSAAFLQMRALGIKIKSMTESHDAMFRQFYFGGRVEALQRGIHRGKYLYLDINSAYPFAMLNNHAHGAEYLHGAQLPPREQLSNCFVRLIADSKGAFPLRSDNGSLTFPHVNDREFYVTGWEVTAGLETKTIKIRKVMDVWLPRSFINFRPYVETFFARRQAAKEANDEIGRLAYKYLLNSGYGKFAQNPREFKTYALAPYGEMPDNLIGWDWETDFGAISLWSKPSYQGYGFFDVATGASITGFVRAMLWRAICQSRDVLYCDTDSLICRSSRVPLGSKLGEWKPEHSPGVFVKHAAIAGKKLYGIEWSKPDNHGNVYKIASKGARLNFREILDLCRGKSIIWENAAPTFSLGNPHFVRREINAT